MIVFPNPELGNVAPATRKHQPLAWILLALSALLCVLSLYYLRQSMRALDDIEIQQREFKQSIKRQTDKIRKEAQQNSALPAMERDKAQRQLQDFVHMSWDGIFDALEVAVDAVRNGVSIVALVPTRVQPSNIELTITALASNTPIMLTYLKALKSDPRVLQVELAAQQPDDKSGPGVLRFQFNMVCNPKTSIAHPTRPTRPILPPALAGAPSTTVVRPNTIVPPAVLNSATTPVTVPVRKH